MRTWKWKAWLLLVFFLSGVASVPGADKRENVSSRVTRYDLLLLPQDVEQASNFLGVKLVPEDPMTGALGKLNFALPRGPVVLMLNGQDVDVREFAKQKETGSFKAQYAFRFKGLGDDAYEGPAQKGNLYVLAFQKGNHWVTLTAGWSRRENKPFLSMEQLQELAKLILKRL
jgi:hypothetical protein